MEKWKRTATDEHGFFALKAKNNESDAFESQSTIP